jgi:hypothetical protein
LETTEPVFIAANVREAEFIERLLEEEGIEYQVHPEAYTKGPTGVCLQGLMFEVLAGQAPYCRRLFEDRGLKRGIVGDPSPC